MSPAGAQTDTPAAPSSRRTVPAAVFWLGLYLAAVTVPLFALLPHAGARGGGFVWDFAMALGYAGLAMLGVQFALTARFRRATAPFGIDIVYYFHRYLAVCALLIVVAHYVILRVGNPAALGAADPRLAPANMSAGRAALLLFVVVAVLSLARRALRFEYDRWRATHALLATLAFALAIGHMFGAGHYLDRPWKQALWAVYGVFWLGLIAYVRVLRPWRVLRTPYRVAEVRPERGHVWTLALEPTSGEGLRFAPGQFAWLTLRASPYAMREHPFSIASSAMQPGRIELGIKELGDFTATIKDIRPGETAYLDAPYGTFGIDHHPDAPGYVFIAGGIGIAPILSMLRTLGDRADRRPLVLFYGNRMWERVAFREELEALAQRLSLRVVHVLIEPPPDWTGECGFITHDVLARHLPVPPLRLQYFLCGPTPMTRDVERSLAALKVPAARVHSEIFDWV
ncbi:MAG: ferric reductase-like transmembrane domain-containing protein [Polaromonas sp.]|nr:ferric reductase-like transmembrane domain-containing protein [Polaromonas sp.]